MYTKRSQSSPRSEWHPYHPSQWILSVSPEKLITFGIPERERKEYIILDKIARQLEDPEEDLLPARSHRGAVLQERPYV